MRIELCLTILVLLTSSACSDDNTSAQAAKAQPTSQPAMVATPTPEVQAIEAPASKEATTSAAPDVEPTPVASDAPIAEPDDHAEISIDIRNSRLIDGSVLLGGQPSETQFSTAAEMGYQLIVTLRGTDEAGTSAEQAMVEGLGMRFLRIAMANGGGLTEENARALASVLDDPSNRPLMVHCGSGNRVGGLFALKAFFVDGVDRQAALAIGRKAGMRVSLEPRVKAAMK